MTCKGICIRHEAARPADGYRYSNGQNRCRVCDLFIEWGGVKCPCCGMTLSTRQHRSKTWGSIKNSKERSDRRWYSSTTYRGILWYHCKTVL